jgi:SAM-dependent methyltransferase
MNRQAHWDQIFSTKASDEVSWFQAEPAASLRLLDAAGMTTASRVIDIGGGDSWLVDRLLDRGVHSIVVLDVSGTALARARARLGERQSRVTWIEADVTGAWDGGDVDIWHDRAAFHFLTDADDRQRYVTHLRHAVTLGGAAIIATFALDGPDTCSGLPVVRYSPETLGAELGSEFRIAESRNERHQTPSGMVQSFCYIRFTRVS